jgi:hypothetical protein
MLPSNRLGVLVITSAHDVRNFDCGNAALNEFLIKPALANTSAGIARAFVTTLENHSAVIGYFSIIPFIGCDC